MDTKIYDADNAIAKMELEVRINDLKEEVKIIKKMATREVAKKYGCRIKAKLVRQYESEVEDLQFQCDNIKLEEIEVERKIVKFDPVALLMGDKNAVKYAE